MGYLVAAYAVVWGGTFLYLLHLSRRERRLQAEIRQFQARLVQAESPGQSNEVR